MPVIVIKALRKRFNPSIGPKRSLIDRDPEATRRELACAAGLPCGGDKLIAEGNLSDHTHARNHGRAIEFLQIGQALFRYTICHLGLGLRSG
jgi:hypothetical protein